jgi:outer membrane lipoprotein-sorting protein
MKRWIWACLAAFLSNVVFAETSAEKGFRLAEEADDRDSGFVDFVASMEMILRDRAGDESARQVRVRILEVKGGGDKRLSLFDEPADVKGTAMLTYSHALEPDDQWLYLPALGRVKRITSHSKSGPFMGSEFAYEDLGSQELAKYSYKYLREESCANGQRCWVIERVPADKYSGYSRQVLWMDQTEYRTHKVDYFDRKGDHLKTLLVKGYKEYLGRYWRPSEMFMENHQTGKSTLLKWRDYRFRVGLGDNDFNKNALARLR